jgi:hypothetical protein
MPAVDVEAPVLEALHTGALARRHLAAVCSRLLVDSSGVAAWAAPARTKKPTPAATARTLRTTPPPSWDSSREPGIPRGRQANHYDGRRAPLAQLDRARPSGGRGRRFESCRARPTPVRASQRELPHRGEAAAFGHIARLAQALSEVHEGGVLRNPRISRVRAHTPSGRSRRCRERTRTARGLRAPRTTASAATTARSFPSVMPLNAAQRRRRRRQPPQAGATSEVQNAQRAAAIGIALRHSGQSRVVDSTSGRCAGVP